MNFPNQAFSDWSTLRNITGDKIECVPVIQQLFHIIEIRIGNGFALYQIARLLQGESSAFDMCRMVRFENQGAAPHFGDPIIGQGSCFDEAARPFDSGQICRYSVGDGEYRIHF